MVPITRGESPQRSAAASHFTSEKLWAKKDLSRCVRRGSGIACATRPGLGMVTRVCRKRFWNFTRSRQLSRMTVRSDYWGEGDIRRSQLLAIAAAAINHASPIAVTRERAGHLIESRFRYHADTVEVRPEAAIACTVCVGAIPVGMPRRDSGIVSRYDPPLESFRVGLWLSLLPTLPKSVLGFDQARPCRCSRSRRLDRPHSQRRMEREIFFWSAAAQRYEETVPQSCRETETRCLKRVHAGPQASKPVRHTGV